MSQYLWSYLVVLPVAMYFFNQFGLYRNAGSGAVRLIWNVGKSMTIAAVAAVGVAYMFKDSVVSVSRVWVVLYATVATTLIVAKHLGWRRYAYREATSAARRRTVALVGAREQNHEIAQRIARHAEWGIAVAVQLDCTSTRTSA